MLDITGIAKSGLGIVDHIVGGISNHVNNQDEIEKTRVHGEIEEKLLNAQTNANRTMEEEKRKTLIAQGEQEIEKLKINGQFKKEEKELDNMREKEKENHYKEMITLENKHKETMEKEAKKHEIDLLKQNDESKKVDAQIEIDKNNSIEENRRKLIDLENSYSLKNKQLDANIKKELKKLEIEEKKVNNEHVKEIKNIDNKQVLDMQRLNMDAEKMRLDDKRQNKEIDNKYKLDMKDAEIKEKELELNINVKLQELENEREDRKDKSNFICICV